MSPLEIISRLCDVTENLSAIVKKQQTIIEQSKIEEAVRAELRQEVEETDREMKQLRERVVIVEQSLKSYHKRLDGEQHSDR